MVIQLLDHYFSNVCSQCADKEVMGIAFKSENDIL